VAAVRTPQGRTSVPRTTARLLTAGALCAAGIAAFAVPARAADSSVWDRVAACESSGNWSADTGNGYYGGLQFSASTWDAYGGRAYAATASGASESAQIAVANRVLSAQGPGAWPVCGPRAGLSRGDAGSAPAVVQASPVVHAAVRETAAVRSVSASRAVDYALAQVGTAYGYGDEGPRAFDCSGLVQAAWRAAGVAVPRTSSADARLPRAALAAGDIIVYTNGSHVALYIGHGDVVVAENPSTGVRLRTVAYDAQGRGWYAVRPAGVRLTSSPASKPSKPAPVPRTTGHTVTVRRGDTLSGIAAEYRVPGGWQALYRDNARTIGADPGLIYPGEVLHW